MINQFPRWKNLLVLAVVLFGAVYALPNIYGEDPAIQVSRENSVSADEATQAAVADALRNAGVDYQELVRRDGLLFATFADTEAQLSAFEGLRAELGRGWIVALNRVSRTPAWLRAIGGGPMSLGLDLVGGVHFLLEVDLDAAVTQAEERYENAIRATLRDENIRYGLITRESVNGIRITFRDAGDRDRAESVLDSAYNQLDVRTVDDTDVALSVVLTEIEIENIRRFAVEQNLITLRNRVNELSRSAAIPPLPRTLPPKPSSKAGKALPALTARAASPPGSTPSSFTVSRRRCGGRVPVR
jgi:preprotein translocase subunit SecD